MVQDYYGYWYKKSSSQCQGQREAGKLKPREESKRERTWGAESRAWGAESRGRAWTGGSAWGRAWSRKQRLRWACSGMGRWGSSAWPATVRIKLRMSPFLPAMFLLSFFSLIKFRVTLPGAETLRWDRAYQRKITEREDRKANTTQGILFNTG